MITIIYLAIFVTSLDLVLLDKDFATIKKPCLICMPKILIILILIFLFFGAGAFTFFAPRSAWTISGTMTLSISSFMLGMFFAFEHKKRILSLLQMLYVLVITVHFYYWWYV